MSPVPPPPSGDVHENILKELIKQIPYLGKAYGNYETAADKEKNAEMNMRVISLDLETMLKDRVIKKEASNMYHKGVDRGSRQPHEPRHALVERELVQADNNIKTQVGKLRNAVAEYEKAIKEVFEKKDKFAKSMNQYANDAARGII